MSDQAEPPYKNDLQQPLSLDDILLASPKLKKEVERLRNRVRNDPTVASKFEKIVYDHLPLLQVCNCERKLKDVLYKNFRSDVNKALVELGYPDMVNMGDGLSDKTLLLIILHYATDAEKNVRAGGDDLSKMDHNVSSCVAFPKVHLPSSLVREYARKVLGLDEEGARKYWNEYQNRITGSITTVDHRIMISEDKDNYQNELKIVVAKDNTNMSVLDLIGAMNAAYHNRYYYLRTGGKKLSVIMMSITLWDTVLDRCDPVETAISNFRGPILHSEGWLAGYIRDVLTYTDEKLAGFERTIAEGFADIFEHILGVTDFPFYDTDIAHRFAHGKLTAEEVEALRKLLLAIRIRGGTTCGLMRTLVTAIIKSSMSRKNIEEEEAINLIPSILVELDKQYQVEVEQVQEEVGTSSNNDVVYVAYKQLLEHQPKKRKELRLKLDKLTEKLKSLYNGSAVSGIMRTLSKEIFSLDDITRESNDEDITRKLEQLKASYDANKSVGSSDGTLNVFSRLIKYKPDIVNDLPSLSSKLKRLYNGNKLGGTLGGTTAGLMNILASKIYSLAGMTIESSTIDIMCSLEALNRRYNEAGSSDDSNDEALSAFTKLVEHKPSFVDDFESLSSKLQNSHLGSMLTKHMNKLARSLIVSAISRGHDLEQAKQQIQSELESVKTQFSSSKSAGDEATTVNSTSAMTIYTALVKLKPAIAEECTVTLSSKLSNIVSDLNVEWEARLEELRQYKLNTDDSKPFAVGDDNSSLKYWFLKQMNLFGVPDWATNTDLKLSYIHIEKLNEVDELWDNILVMRRLTLENAGVTFIEPSERRKTPGRVDRLKRMHRKRKLK